ncbi:MAG TPA: FAD-binding oxidoreductase [Thermoleophilaceae bacterium]|nr:FAD-binding oxidoreductase [Thermoleophilaceae bacterium]
MTTIDTTLSGLEVLSPADEGWDAARQAFNLTIDQRPDLIALARSEADVAAVVRFASREGLKVAPQTSGHNAGPLGSLDGTVLLKTRGLRGVAIDAQARKARVKAGVKWEDLVPQASELGLAALHGSSPDVGIVGYSLGGGMGWYARKHGLQANSVTAIELVTADGELRRVDADHEPELFWALRGGGGNFGVVTAIEFDLYPIEQVYAGTLFFPFERGGEVLHAWREWTASTPDEITSTAKLLQFPPLEEIPEIVRGQSFAVVSAAFLGSEADGVELTRPLRELGPAMDTFAMVPPVALSDLAMDPPDPVPYVGDSQMVGDLPAEAIDDLLAVAGPGSGSPLVMVELRQAGGALARAAGHHGALASLAGSFVSMAVGAVLDEASAAAGQAQLALLHDALAPHQVGHYLNFTEVAVDPRSAYGADAYARLQALKGEYDPDGLFRANHRIG